MKLRATLAQHYNDEAMMVEFELAAISKLKQFGVRLISLREFVTKFVGGGGQCSCDVFEDCTRRSFS